MRRRFLPFALAFVAAAGTTAGCTFLIDFEEASPAAEAGLEASLVLGPDVRVEETGVLDGGADARDAIADPDACRNNQDGKYCPNNQITWPGNDDDLITCKARAVANVRLCATGNGCIRMANGYPDQCDDCAKKDAGTFCGRDLGWEPKNAERLVRCQNGAVVDISSAPCPDGCASNGVASACK